MPIDPVGHNPMLRLTAAINPVRRTQPTQPAHPTQRPQRVQAGDNYDFAAVYKANLPRLRLTEAHQRLERVRNELVGAKVGMPIHFENSQPRPASANAAIRAYMRVAPSPADSNAAATERAVSGQ